MNTPLIWICACCVKDGSMTPPPMAERTDGLCNLHEELTRMDWGLAPWQREEQRTA